MAMNVKHPFVDHKCPDCARDDQLINQVRDEGYATNAQKFLMAGKSKGWTGQQLWKAVLARKDRMEEGIMQAIKTELMKSNPKAVEDVEERNNLLGAFLKFRVPEERAPSKKLSLHDQEKLLSENEVVIALMKEAIAVLPKIKGSAAMKARKSLLAKGLEAWNTPLKEEPKLDDTDIGEWDLVSDSGDDEWVQVPVRKTAKNRTSVRV
jgi:hypothetical protein